MCFHFSTIIKCKINELHEDTGTTADVVKITANDADKDFSSK